VSTLQDHADAVLDLLRADAQLTVYDGQVTGTADHYVLVYTFRQLPGGLIAPDKTSLTGDTTTVDMRFYCHCVGANAVAARAVQARVEARLLDVVPTVVGRECFPIRWLDGQQHNRDEETLALVVDTVDVYGLTSVPA
jgi:hypothetical protein